MPAHAPTFEVNALGAFPALILVLFLVLTALGVIAHGAFA